MPNSPRGGTRCVSTELTQAIAAGRSAGIGSGQRCAVRPAATSPSPVRPPLGLPSARVSTPTLDADAGGAGPVREGARELPVRADADVNGAPKRARRGGAGG